jgi:hypothetical protein
MGDGSTGQGFVAIKLGFVAIKIEFVGHQVRPEQFHDDTVYNIGCQLLAFYLS